MACDRLEIRLQAESRAEARMIATNLRKQQHIIFGSGSGEAAASNSTEGNPK